ncbi:hypothetical protein [Maribellus sp. YY47]|uniref:hypothetical protein n=1 Tax=Maribellus sp. YY47 TaxID=2929486 RepID=UPI00200098CA|nr:hypothetical protein [Maribellus sp. YY47]MCK3684535.1 hypothetical protein [Maribellus sp. YY47]
MKKLFTILLLFNCLTLAAQHEKFLVQGKIVDETGESLPDVYIINLSTHERDISRDNGIFALWVSPSDSLLFSHISFYRKVLKVSSIMINPIVKMESEQIGMKEIVVSPNRKTDMDRAKENMSFLNEYEVPPFEKIRPDENNPVTIIMTQNNQTLRVEAASVSLFRFSPSDVMGKMILRSKNKRASDYDYTRKVKHPEENKTK